MSRINTGLKLERRRRRREKGEIEVEPPFEAKNLPRYAISVAHCLNVSHIVFQLFQVKGFCQKLEPLFHRNKQHQNKVMFMLSA